MDLSSILPALIETNGAWWAAQRRNAHRIAIFRKCRVGNERLNRPNCFPRYFSRRPPFTCVEAVLQHFSGDWYESNFRIFDRFECWKVSNAFYFIRDSQSLGVCPIHSITINGKHKYAFYRFFFFIPFSYWSSIFFITVWQFHFVRAFTSFNYDAFNLPWSCLSSFFSCAHIIVFRVCVFYFHSVSVANVDVSFHSRTRRQRQIRRIDTATTTTTTTGVQSRMAGPVNVY